MRSYVATDAEVEKVLLSHRRQLADFVFAQMMEHYRETPLGEVKSWDEAADPVGRRPGQEQRRRQMVQGG